MDAWDGERDAESAIGRQIAGIEQAAVCGYGVDIGGLIRPVYSLSGKYSDHRWLEAQIADDDLNVGRRLRDGEWAARYSNADYNSREQRQNSISHNTPDRDYASQERLLHHNHGVQHFHKLSLVIRLGRILYEPFGDVKRRELREIQLIDKLDI